MSEENSHVGDNFWQRNLAGIVTTALGGLLLFLILLLINAPSAVDEDSRARHRQQAEEIAELRELIGELEEELGTLRLQQKELQLLLAAGTGDRFTGKEWALEKQHLQTLQKNTDESIARIEANVGRIVKYISSYPANRDE